MTRSLRSFSPFRLRTFSLLLLATSLLAQAQTIRYVKPTATGTGNGSSWANASGDLQAMINASSSAQQVWVAQGTYKPGGNANTDRFVNFSMKDGVAIYGGFVGNETGLSQRPAITMTTPSSTTLSGDIGIAANSADNSYRVIYNLRDLTTSAVLDGFLITGGNSNSSGGGMYNSNSSPTVQNCSFQNNSAVNDGGAMYNEGTGTGSSNPVLINCSFLNNSTVNGSGAAMCNDGSNGGVSSPVLTNCSFLNNSARYGGGAIFNNGNNGGVSSPVLTNCSFLNNSASSRGGAMYTLSFNGTGSPVLTNCVLFGNGGERSISTDGGGTGTVSARYSLFETGTRDYNSGAGNRTTAVSPFISATDARLNACAAAINAGDNAANSTTTDPAGNPRRYNGGQIDMGAYEYQGDPNFPISITQQPPSGSAVCQGNTISTPLGVSGTVSAYQWYKDGALVSGQTSATLTLTNVQPAQSGLYSVVVTGACNSVTTTAFSLTVNDLPMVYAVTGGGAYCAGSNGIGVGLSGSQPGVNYQLLRDNNPVGSPVAGTGGNLNFGNQSSAGTYTVRATNPTTSCQQAMIGSTAVTITPRPDAPALVTQSSQPYPAGVSSLTIAQNVGPVSLTVLGCSGGMIMANGNAASSFTVSTAMTGTQTYTATCTQGGCTSPAGSFQLTVVPTTLSVLHRDTDYGNTQNNIIKPYLQLANADGQAIPYGELTVRYWFTAEGQAPPTNLAVYYAQLGAVSMKYVALAQPRQGAFGYIEYSFPGGGNLAANGNSGPIENGIQKTDNSAFNESDDYSYAANYQNYVPNIRVTAYRNGIIIWGQEPTMVQSQTAVAVYSAAKDGTTASQIQTRLELRNTGNTALPVGALKLRYYFTSDNNQPANVFVDYADIGAAKVAARVIKLPAPVEGADSYVELSFPNNTMLVNALSSLGVIDFRLVRSDNGLFSQSNDYSYAANYGNVGLNNRVTVLLDNRLIFGTPPSGAPARLGASEPVAVLRVQVLGNPVVGDQAHLLITGVAGQAVSLRLVDLRGHTIHEQRIQQAAETESVSVPLGQSRGQLLLRVSTESQQQSVKLLRP